MTITTKQLDLDMWLLLDTNKKSYLYVGIPTAPLDLTLRHLERERESHSDFEAYTSYTSYVNLIRPYVAIKHQLEAISIPSASSHLTLMTFIGTIQGHSDCEVICLVIEPSSAISYILLNINRKSYMGGPMTPLSLTLNELEMSNSMSRRF